MEVASLEELARRKRKLVVVGTQQIGLFLIGGTVYAVSDVCVHKQRSLTKGTVLNGQIICPGHQWAFDPQTGRAADREECQPTYDVRIEQGAVFVNPSPRALTSEER
ncbi:Rieske (2Fe-2S) protein [Sinosporangium siamense]|uniref:Rieske domain-containing protein n=1 Tax=Sinosporangium siamense TaxID=1367973 RepID=A0A919V6T2_9ACTN|nr:Rieske 2Fe-2S domain-containing protein [Sinosporangium siamense]GII92326.1 hypothetical protein Ssi02_25570 [Sinosporangium siamense]